MKIEVLPDAAALAQRAADAICAAVGAKPSAVLGLPTGATPIEAYAELTRRAAAGEADFSRATAFAVDEFAAASRDAPGTNAAFFARHLRLPLAALRVPRADAPDPDAEIRAFADEVRRAGGMDLCVLGIGVNGHIAFNEPDSARASRARAVELRAESRAAHAAAFGSLDAVPRIGMTLGIADILEARAILVLASGARKAAIVARAVEGDACADVPASWLREHPGVTWMLDEAAASGLTRR